MTHLEVLESELRNFQIDLPSEQKLTLSRYCDEVDRWNKKINLTGLRGAEMVRRLVVEPVWIGLRLRAGGTLVDIGSGNGSPGIPLHVVSNFQTTHLIEVRTKRAAFLRHLTVSLKLSDVSVQRARFEEVASQLGQADWTSLQAVALTEELIEIIRVNLPTTTVVWITSTDQRPPTAPSQTLNVPHTNTKVFLFRLDLS